MPRGWEARSKTQRKGVLLVYLSGCLEGASGQRLSVGERHTRRGSRDSSRARRGAPGPSKGSLLGRSSPRPQRAHSLQSAQWSRIHRFGAGVSALGSEVAEERESGLRARPRSAGAPRRLPQGLSVPARERRSPPVSLGDLARGARCDTPPG